MEDSVLESKIEQILGAKLAALDEKIQRDITGAIGRVSRKYDNHKQEIEGNITRLSESLELNKNESDFNSNNSNDNNESEINDNNNESEIIASLKQQLLEVETERDRILSEAKIKELEDNFVAASAGKIYNPRGFLRLLRDVDGVVFQEEDKLLVNTSEISEDGLPRRVEVVDYLDILLEDEEYAHFAMPRSGSEVHSRSLPNSYLPGNRSNFSTARSRPDIDSRSLPNTHPAGNRSKYFNPNSDDFDRDSGLLLEAIRSGKLGDVISELDREFDF